MIRIFRTSTISTPSGKAFWFLFHRPGLTALRFVSYAVIVGIVYIILAGAGIAMPWRLLAMLGITFCFLFAPRIAFRVTMKDFRRAFQHKDADKILEDLDRTSEKLRKSRTLHRFRWLLFNDNAYPRDICVAASAAAFAKWINRDGEARDRFDNILEACPDHVLAWLYLGEINAEGGDVTTAMHCFEKALEICPSFHYTKIVQAAWLYAYDRASAARDLLATVPPKEKKRFAIIPSLAATFALAEDRVDDARNHIQQALEKEPVPKLCKEMCKAVFPDLYKPEL